jgi:NitT/TauT family transport system substrate-binding protein
MMKLKHFFMLFCVVMLSKVVAAEPTIIKIGVQAGGTVEWELSALPASTDVKIETLAVANAEAGKIALQSGAVDMIVSDWLWVANQHSQGTDFTFYPYSSTAGALVVPKDSPIQTIKDLNGKRLGIAGGELDKNWLLLQALAQKDGVDLNKSVEKTFGAPPLITEQLKEKRVDAALTYWHFAAKLEAAGFKQLIDGRGILKGLGINENIPNLGYVFKADWANQHKKALTDFFAASSTAKKTLCTDDNAWQKVIPLTKTDDQATQKLLRQRYCEGSIESFGEKEQTAAAKVFLLLKDLSKGQLTGNAESFPVGTFWNK